MSESDSPIIEFSFHRLETPVSQTLANAMSRYELLRMALLLMGLFSGAFGSRADAGGWKVQTVGRFVFDDDSVRELSGITWVSTDSGRTLYYCVSDNKPKLIPLRIVVDLDSGQVTSATLGEPVSLNDGSEDLEGICFDPRSGSVFISNESEPGIREHDVTSGHLLQKVDAESHPQLIPFQNTIQNKAWESLAMSSDGTAIWTANEDSLSSDPADTIRLQRFDRELNPTGQWAYDLSSPPEEWTVKFALGVPDLLALPDGGLVVMERGFGPTRKGLKARIQLFHFELSRARNLGSGSLEGAIRVAKTLLWEQRFIVV